jgi:hypothetical protein
MLTANRAKRLQVRYDEEASLRLLQRTAEVFDRSLTDKLQRIGELNCSRYLLSGMPRSGSTLTEQQILSSHPEVYGAGSWKIWVA